MFMGGSWVKFSFQHETYRAPQGYWVDSGKPYGPQRTLMTKTYGEENGFSITGYGVFVTGNCGANIITSMTECEAARKALAHTGFFFSSFKNPDDIDSSMQVPAGCVLVVDTNPKTLRQFRGYYVVPENTTNRGSTAAGTIGASAKPLKMHLATNNSSSGGEHSIHLKYFIWQKVRGRKEKILSAP